MANYKDIKYQFPTSAVTSGTFADGRISESSVTQHASATDLQPLKADITALALREATNEASAAFNLPNQFIETFTDDTNLGTETQGDRVVGGFWGTTYDTTQSSIIDFTGDDSYLIANDSTLLPINNTNFTWETWFYVHPDHLNENQGLGGGNVTQHNINVMSNPYHATDNIGLYIGNAGSWVVTPSNMTTSTSHSTWYHFAWTKESGVISAFFNGNRIYTASPTWTSSGTDNWYGRWGYVEYNTGYMTEWRISDNVRYTGTTYTIPTSAFSNDGNTLLLMHSNTTNGSTTWTDSSSNGHTITDNGGSVTHSTAVASPLSTSSSYATGTLIQSTNTVGSAKTKVGGTMLYKDNEGTATLGTDLKIYFTCNGGTNWTEAASYNAITPVYSTGIKQVRLGETTCTSGTDIRYKAVWANQSSGSKETQLHGIGINY
jgi:hypothetical protein